MRRPRALPSVTVFLLVVSVVALLVASPVKAANTSETSAPTGEFLAVGLHGGVLSALPPPATFNVNLLLTGSSSAGEPSIRTDRFGRPLVIAAIGVPDGCK